jgi:hypothetical protein
MSKKFTIASGPVQGRRGRGALQGVVVRAFGSSFGDDDDDDEDYFEGGLVEAGQAASAGSKKRPASPTADRQRGPSVRTESVEVGHSDEPPPTQEAAERVDNDDLELFDEDDAAGASDSGDADDNNRLVRTRLRRAPEHWVGFFLQEVPFEQAKLCAAAQKVVSKMDEYPELMWYCPLGPENWQGTGVHNQYMLMPARRFHSNIVSHFDGHRHVKKWMEDAVARGEDLSVAAANCKKMVLKVSGQRSILTMLPRKTATEKATDGLLVRERRELSLAVWTMGTQTAPNALRHHTWATFLKEASLTGLHDALKHIHYPLVEEAAMHLMREEFIDAGFVHSEMDFMTVGLKSVLVVAAHTVVAFELRSHLVGIVEYTGFGGAEHVSQITAERLERVAPGVVIHAANTADGALAAASELLVGEDDAVWCFAHQQALPIKKSLDLTKYPGSVVAYDFGCAQPHLQGVAVGEQGHHLYDPSLGTGDAFRTGARGR